MLPSGPGPQNQQLCVSGGGGCDGEICPNSLSPTTLTVPLLQTALHSGSGSLGWEGNCGQLSGNGEEEGRESRSRGRWGCGQPLGQRPGGLLRCQGTPKSGTIFYSVTLCLGMLRITASDVSSPRVCLLSFPEMRRNRRLPTSVEKRANLGKAVTEAAVSSPLTFPDFSDAATGRERQGKMRSPGAVLGGERGKSFPLPRHLVLPACRVGTVPACLCWPYRSCVLTGRHWRRGPAAACAVRSGLRCALMKGFFLAGPTPGRTCDAQHAHPASGCARTRGSARLWCWEMGNVSQEWVFK